MTGIKIGIDVGGTFTDFLVTEGDRLEVHKTLSTPGDPSEGVINGLSELARKRDLPLRDFAESVDVIVHGTTVTTNALLTLRGETTGLLTTEGLRDALEMRRGIREEQYNNRAVNAPPLVPRRHRLPLSGRVDAQGNELAPLDTDQIQAGIELFREAGVKAVALCFMNSFANASQEQHAARVVKELMPEAYLSVSSELLPSIRFYERLSTTVLNAYVGPLLDAYLERLTARLAEVGFSGVLLVMQSNGGVVSPEVARRRAAVTLLSGPAAGPVAGLVYGSLHGKQDCITMDMGGTSFDAAMVLDGAPTTATGGTIARYAIALPMLDIVTIGAGGGSIGWLDEGGLLRMGPQSAGADPGPACYGRGGQLPSCTDADLLLGYLNPEFFAGGKLPLRRDAAEKAVQTLAAPLGLSVEETAAGMYRLINTNMANGVRQASVQKGLDPREFLIISAGGAGPNHSCMICSELDIKAFIVPRESSIFCAAGMLMSDLVHHLVRSFVAPLSDVEVPKLAALLEELRHEGQGLLRGDGVAPEAQDITLALDLRYVQQYHEVTVPVDWASAMAGQWDQAEARFHREHNRLYGYSLEEESTPVELINVRLEARGRTDKPRLQQEPYAGSDPSVAAKGHRRAYLPERNQFDEVPVYDGALLRHGHRLRGPALIEQVNTTTFVSAAFDAVCDGYGSFLVYAREVEEEMLKGIEHGR
jgi:N-methylhydantoinase A